MKILIYSVVVGGMGDIMFAKHLGNYVTKWCDEANIDMKLSYAFNSRFDPNDKTVKKRLKKSGINPKQIINLKYAVDKNLITSYGITKSIPGFDLFLLAPVSTALFRLPEYVKWGPQRITPRPPGPSPMRPGRPSHYASYNMYVPKKALIVDDLARSFPGASSSNTVLFSVYNPEDDADVNDDFDFPMGVGDGKFGIFIKPPPSVQPKLPRELEGKRFVLIYVSPSASQSCVRDFVNHVSGKYAPLSIVLPPHTYTNLGSPSIPGVEFLTKLLPLDAAQFSAVVKYSLPDIMMTGNQSVSDVISCCTDKTLWYQGDVWTAEFGEALNRYGGAHTCDGGRPSGSLLDIKNNWNFEHRGKSKLMNIINKTRLILSMTDEEVETHAEEINIQSAFNQLPSS
jgi:hypothetical protein